MSMLSELHGKHLARQAKFFAPVKRPVTQPTPPAPVAVPQPKPQPFRLAPTAMAVEIALPQTPVQRIVSIVAQHYGVARDDLLTPSRKHRFVVPRQVAMYLARKMTRHSLPQIGRAVRRDHTTVIYSVQQIGRAIERDASFAEEIAAIQTKVEAA